MVEKIRIMKKLDCACVIFGDAYDWGYVEKLYAMLSRHVTIPVILHVYTEEQRYVPAPFVKHVLPDLDIIDPKKLWWYKICLFDTTHHKGPLLYFDLDTVIVDNIDWIWNKSTDFFWAIQDFKALWRPFNNVSNTSLMWWDTTKYEIVWQTFQRNSLRQLLRNYHGDQDFVSDTIPDKSRKFLDQDRIKSWRWQSFDGGYDFKKRLYREPGTGTRIHPKDCVLIFHGQPKPDSIQDPMVLEHWK